MLSQMLILFLGCSKGLNWGLNETSVGCTGIDAVWNMLEIGETYCGDVRVAMMDPIVAIGESE